MAASQRSQGPDRPGRGGPLAVTLEAASRLGSRLLLLQEPFAEPGLIEALTAEGYDVVAPTRRPDAWQAVRDVEQAPDVVIVPIEPGQEQEIRRLRRLRVLESPPFLGVTREGSGEVSRETLRCLGVAGLVDRAAGLEHLLFRLDQILRPPVATRRHQRVPVFFAVAVRTGSSSWEALYAHTLSQGGMGLVADRPVEVNTDLSLRFEFRPAPEPLEVSARVVYCQALREAAGLHRIGVFFYPMPAEREQCLVEFVERAPRERGGGAAESATP